MYFILLLNEAILMLHVYVLRIYHKIQCNLYLFQSPFNVVTLRAIGDDSGPTYFSFDTNTGQISIRQDLRLDTATLYRVCQLLSLLVPLVPHLLIINDLFKRIPCSLVWIEMVVVVSPCRE